MKTVLIANTIPSTTTDLSGINSIVDGELQIIIGDSSDTTLVGKGLAINGVVTSIPKIKSLIFATGHTAGLTALRTEEIKKGTLSWSKSSYSAPITKEIIVGQIYNGSAIVSATSLNFTSGSKIGKTATIRIYDLDIPNITMPEPSFVHETTEMYSDTDSNDTFINRIISKIQNHSKKFIASAVAVTNSGNVGIKLSGVSGRNFGVTVSGLLASADVSYGAALLDGATGYAIVKNNVYTTLSATNHGLTIFKNACGTPALVNKAIGEYYATIGNENYQNVNNNEMFKLLGSSTIGNTYDTYSITYKSPKYTDMLGTKDDGYIKHLELYVKVGAGADADTDSTIDLEEILNALA